MKFLRYLLPMVVAAGFISSQASADCTSPDPFHDETRQRDFEAVQEFVNSKRTIGLEQKDCNLTIAGDIRFDWANIVEKVECHKLRGKNGTAREDEITHIVTDQFDGIRTGIPFSTNAFEVEFNLYFDYVCDRAWGVAWLQFADQAGIERSRRFCSFDREGLYGSGCCGNICLKKAYMGYNLIADGCNRLDIELGRRPLYTVFDSRIEFQSRFDGLLLKYARHFDCWGDFFWNLGAFVVDERVDHYAYVTELGMLNIGDYGFDLRYSFIDWKSLNRHNRNRCGTNHPRGIDYRVSQWLLEYHLNPEYLFCIPAKLYGAFLWNHSAKKFRGFDSFESSSSSFSSSDCRHQKKKNLGWYAGFIIGEVCREGDWSLDITYEVVQSRAIPDRDVSGIGGGNNLLGQNIASDGRGFTNFKGWRFEGLYALTDNLALDANFEYSTQEDKRIVGKHSYSKFELEAIYAF